MKISILFIILIDKIKRKCQAITIGNTEGQHELSSFKMRFTRKKKTEKSSLRKIKIKEKFYKSSFYIFEVGFIIIAVPVLIISIFSIPILVYFTLVQNFQLWPFIILGTMIAFTQMLAIKIFVKKFYLDPYDMTFGEYLRFRYDNRKIIEEDENKPMKTWYDNLDQFTVQIRETQREQTRRIYASNYKNVKLSS